MLPNHLSAQLPQTKSLSNSALMIGPDQYKRQCPVCERRGLLRFKAALATFLLDPCGPLRQNVQVDSGPLRGLTSSHWEETWASLHKVIQGPALYTSEQSLNEGCYCCCLELEALQSLFSACTAVREPGRRGGGIVSSVCVVLKTAGHLCNNGMLECYLKVSLVLNTACPCSPVPCLMNRWLWSPWRGAL